MYSNSWSKIGVLVKRLKTDEFGTTAKLTKSSTHVKWLTWAFEKLKFAPAISGS